MIVEAQEATSAMLLTGRRQRDPSQDVYHATDYAVNHDGYCKGRANNGNVVFQTAVFDAITFLYPFVSTCNAL